MLTHWTIVFRAIIGLVLLSLMAARASAQGGGTSGCAPLPPDLIAWWTAEGSGQDTVGVADAALVNGTALAAGIVGQAFALDGSDDYVIVPADPNLAVFSGPFSLELWLKLDTFAGSYLTVMAKGATNRLWLSIRPDGRVENYPEIVGTTVLVPGTWYHVALVADMTNEYLYLNGLVEATVARTDFVEAHGQSVIGAAPTLDSEFVDGLIDEVSLYDRALTAAEVAAIHAAGADGKCHSNNPPVAIDDFYGVDQLGALNEPAPGLLVNDSDSDALNTLTAVLVTGPLHAPSFQLNSNGSFTYVPSANHYGPDTFTYKAYDGTAYSETATVHVTVQQPGSQGFITGGGKFFKAGRKCTFGFVAKVQGNGVQGNL
ncbi:MAG: cadherin-like domain-containing protein, partial [Planctomycetaceae bacterium]|nr:cadherin-like domain-containing protein [Planctomycetaceae bacterium]